MQRFWREGTPERARGPGRCPIKKPVLGLVEFTIFLS